MKFRQKTHEIEAVQWMKNGDHPAVAPYDTLQGAAAERKCAHCGNPMHDHGIISPGHIVCRGDYIVTRSNGSTYPNNRVLFENTYEPVTD